MTTLRRHFLETLIAAISQLGSDYYCPPYSASIRFCILAQTPIVSFALLSLALAVHSVAHLPYYFSTGIQPHGEHAVGTSAVTDVLRLGWLCALLVAWWSSLLPL